jgi:ribosome-associated protein
MQDLRVNDHIVIPAHELSWTSSTGSGPGGQHVNRSQTRVTLRWCPAQSDALDENERARVVSRWAPQLTSDGEILISASTHRSQKRNLDEACRRLAERLRAALVVQRRRRETRPSRGAVERRIKAKKQRSDVKRNRRPPRRDD